MISDFAGMNSPQSSPPLEPVAERSPCFDRIARLYRWMEYITFGPHLSRCRYAFLPGLADCSHALVLGDGDGRFTARLLATNPAISVDAVDASPVMLRLLLQRAGPQAARICTHCADARLWRPTISADRAEPWDLVVSHFFLDCLTTCEIQILAADLRSTLSPSAVWLISEFAIPDSAFGCLVARPIVSLLYRTFGILTGLAVRNLPCYDTALRAAGFALQNRRESLGGLLVSELWISDKSSRASMP
jgi:hypothetical protein